MSRPHERWLRSLRPMSSASGFSNRSRVPVGCAEQGDRLLARAQAPSAHLQVLADDPPVELDWAVEAQRLVDGRIQQAERFPEALQLIGMADSSSPRVSLSPSSSAASRALTRWSRGSRRRASTVVSK